MTNTKKIKNGSLYFNENENRVERVLGTVNTQRVWTKFHKANTKDVQTKHLRLADKEEWNSYLKSKARSLPMNGVIGGVQ